LISLPESSRKGIRTEILCLFVSIILVLACNIRFWRAISAALSGGGNWLFLIDLGVLLIGLHWLALMLLANRWTLKPILSLLACLTAAAVYFMMKYGVFLDKAMIANILETDLREAGELVDWKMAAFIAALGVVPAILIWFVPVRRLGWKDALFIRAGFIAAALAVCVMAGWPILGRLIPIMRAHTEIRYLITPSNYIASTGRVVAGYWKRPAAAEQLRVTAPDARQVLQSGARRPRAIVLVLGETVRAQNWGLNGYARQTTPELAKRDVINFRNAGSCGTDTGTSVPCMFSEYGRRSFDQEKIHASESLLHVLARLKIDVSWLDNQTGCKGVCADAMFVDLSKETDPAFCNGKRCFDDILVKDLGKRIDGAKGDILIVLHMLGSHGPAYFERYPDTFRRFAPTCDTTDIGNCQAEALVNTYDNTILYTDHVVAKAIDALESIASHDVAMIYLSDHGESLGENGLFLHGAPYRIAPAEQTRVPFLLWFSRAFQGDLGFDAACMSERAAKEEISHDVLFHTMLRLFDVKTKSYEPSLDLLHGCSRQAAW
jgi:lipid A ethanolaminephosphotransferase